MMARLLGAILALACTPVSGLLHPARRTTRSRVQMNVVAQSEISANNLKMTDSMKAYVEDKIGNAVGRYEPLVTRCDTHLSVNKNPAVSDSDCCEVVVFAGDHVVRAEERTQSMYSSIDLVAAKLTRKLRKLKERRESRHKGAGKGEALSEAVFDDNLDESGANGASEHAVPLDQIVRTKKFPMPEQTVADAKVCLEWLDHSFYMFKNADTGRISVLYKRREGGLGLIEPDE